MDPEARRNGFAVRVAVRIVGKMKRKGEMLVVGKLRDDFLTQMGRNQRLAHLLAPRAGFRKGVLRFKTWDEAEAWEQKWRESGGSKPPAATQASGAPERRASPLEE